MISTQIRKTERRKKKWIKRPNDTEKEGKKQQKKRLTDYICENDSQHVWIQWTFHWTVQTRAEWEQVSSHMYKSKVRYIVVHSYVQTCYRSSVWSTTRCPMKASETGNEGNLSYVLVNTSSSVVLWIQIMTSNQYMTSNLNQSNNNYN